MHRIEIPPLWLIVFLALAWGSGRAVPFHPFGTPGRWAGAALVALGLLLMAAAVAKMVQRRTTVIPRRDASTLVTGGVFRFSRNPIYLGDALVLAGAALWWDAPLALLLVPAFMALIRRRFIMGEEAQLAARFGPEYRHWATRTRRWM
ncbi:methyltransferase family protein [Acidimangrovimonas sediminis]|uniref:methyltransferase family protein n=1 Tax=Acidimangrovimonas sediminis TaxID=2056283 RepID=UPI000C7F965B|nr:isoprenylcysteine carboxylmethyltransferase family protein [Acidimangrovimonas sediminis]